MMRKVSDLIPGGLADDKPDRLYAKDQVRKGTKVELEHVDSKAKAKEIAKDHLEEQREAGETQDYYDKLLKMEGKSHKTSGEEKHAARIPMLVRIPPEVQAPFRSALSDISDFVGVDEGPLAAGGVGAMLAAALGLKVHDVLKERKKQAEDEGSEPDFDALEANSTAARPIKGNAEQLEKEMDRAKEEQARLQQQTTDPESGEFHGSQYQADKLNHLDNEIGALNKLIRQVRYNIRDSLTPGQVEAVGGSKKEGKTKVSPHGYEEAFPETNRVTNKGESNMLASLGLNIGGGTSGRKAVKPVLSTPSYTGPGDITANNTPGSIEHTAAEKNMDVYEKRAAEVFDHKPSLVDLKEVKVAFFFEGLADALEKRGYYVSYPTEFFVGLYESLREHFEGSAKLASGVYLSHVVNACDLFTKRMQKAAGFEQLQPVNPLDTSQQAQQNALGVSPARQEKRQDIIDAMLPHAETISLDPDGKIKLKMPSPEAAGVMDPQMMQQQQMAEMQGREQAQAASQMPVPSGEETPAPMDKGKASPQGEISPESLQAAEQAMASAGGQGMPEEGDGQEQGGLPDEHELIRALLAGSSGMAG